MIRNVYVPAERAYESSLRQEGNNNGDLRTPEGDHMWELAIEYWYVTAIIIIAAAIAKVNLILWLLEQRKKDRFAEVFGVEPGSYREQRFRKALVEGKLRGLANELARCDLAHRKAFNAADEATQYNAIQLEEKEKAASHRLGEVREGFWQACELAEAFGYGPKPDSYVELVDEHLREKL